MNEERDQVLQHLRRITEGVATSLETMQLAMAKLEQMDRTLDLILMELRTLGKRRMNGRSAKTSAERRWSSTA